MPLQLTWRLEPPIVIIEANVRAIAIVTNGTTIARRMLFRTAFLNNFVVPQPGEVVEADEVVVG